MKEAEIPQNEPERLASLYEYDILDTLPEEDFDDITSIASEICNTPISLITLIDANRQWFKSRHGLDVGETPRSQAFCAHVINDPNNALVVDDATKDDRFFDNPLVTSGPNVHFYAGIPLVNEDGYALGSLCVIDNKASSITPHQLEILQALARQVVCLLELRRKNIQLKQKQKELQNSFDDLEKFSVVASHDLRSPLNNMISLAYLLKEGYEKKIDEEGQEYLEFIIQSANKMNELIKGILEYSRSPRILQNRKEVIVFHDLMKEMETLINKTKPSKLTYTSTVTNVSTSKMALTRILLNLINNAIKYNDKEEAQINIDLTDDKKFYTFVVTDNGIGIEDYDYKRIFQIFQQLKKVESDEGSIGIGLPVVEKLVAHLGGEISVSSIVGKSTTFTFTLAK